MQTQPSAVPNGILDPGTAALIQVGFLKVIDAVFVAVLLVLLVVAIAFASVGQMTILNLAIFIAVYTAIIATWGVILIFRCMYFVLQLRAAVELMPENAGKIAFRMLSVSAAQPS